MVHAFAPRELSQNNDGAQFSTKNHRNQVILPYQQGHPTACPQHHSVPSLRDKRANDQTSRAQTLWLILILPPIPETKTTAIADNGAAACTRPCGHAAMQGLRGRHGMTRHSWASACRTWSMR